VGIGTTLPRTLLDINGYIQLRMFAFHLVPSVDTSYSTNDTLITAFNTFVTDVNASALSAISGGIFTRKIKGYYSIHVNLYSPGASTSWTVRKNATSSTTGTELGGGVGNVSTSSISAIILLDVNDTIKIYTKTATNVVRATVAGGTWPASSFTGLLLSQTN